MTAIDLLVALVIAIGLVGIVVPILPGSVLIVGAVLGWAISVGGGTAWAVFAIATVFVAAGAVVKFVIPGRGLQAAGIPASTQWFGALLGVVGFFVVPVVGLFLGFVLGVWLAEYSRLGAKEAWPSTVHSLKAAGWSIVIELVFGLLAAWTWVAGVILT